MNKQFAGIWHIRSIFKSALNKQQWFRFQPHARGKEKCRGGQMSGVWAAYCTLVDGLAYLAAHSNFT